MNKRPFVQRLGTVVTGLAFAASGPLAAQTTTQTDLCKPEGTVLAFFNGVLNTEAQAMAVLQQLKRIHGTARPDGDQIRYELMYNHTRGFEDFVETFEQRLHEQNGLLGGRFELFFDSMKGGGTWWGHITGAISTTNQLHQSISDAMLAGTIRKLTALFSNPPTGLDYQEHRSRIDNFVLEGKKLLLVAHSQGNLFVNPAFDYAAGKTTPGSLKVVHIAPASPTLRGPHVLADLDLVINGLRLAGTVPGITHYIPGYLLRPPGANGRTDALGHGMFEIYINQQLDISQAVKGLINTALTELVAPPARATAGFFTATLTWDGPGDVDTHVYEPDGTHVWFGFTGGNAGHLDVDNTVANGPEHYYASCDASALQTGEYKIAVANYDGADGRTATVQIASYLDGVLGTQSIILGGATRNTPSATLFTVRVNKDDKNRYKVSLAGN